MTVAELLHELSLMPKDVTVMMPDSQHGDQKIKAVHDTTTYTDGARIVRLEAQ